jgi:hypothetical protein
VRTVFRMIGIVSTVLVVTVVVVGVYLFVQYRPVVESAWDDVRGLTDRLDEQRENLPDLDDAQDGLDRARESIPGG